MELYLLARQDLAVPAVHRKTSEKGKAAWSGKRRSVRKQAVPDQPSYRLNGQSGVLVLLN